MDETDKGDFDPLTGQATGAQDKAEETADKPEDYAAASRQAGNYTQKTAPDKKGPIPSEHDGGHKNLMLSLASLVALAIVAGGVYWFTLRHKPAPVATTSQTQTQNNATPKANKLDTSTTPYTSSNFNLALNYPSDWTLADQGGGIMTIKSPSTQLKNAAGQDTNGTIVLSVRDHSQKLNEFNAGNAVATRDSVKIAYSKPSQTQRANTYISFLQYATTSTHGALDGVYITGDNGYQKGQAIPLVDIQKIDPIISLTFTDPTGKAMSVPDSLWNDTAISGPLTTLLQSFSIN